MMEHSFNLASFLKLHVLFYVAPVDGEGGMEIILEYMIRVRWENVWMPLCWLYRLRAQKV